MRTLVTLAVIAALAPAVAAAQSPWPADARVYIIAPRDGMVVANPVRVVFGLSGLGVAPAGVEKEKTGHHHLLIDTDLPKGEDLETAVPSDAKHLHFGGGQTETALTLASGRHTLQLLMGDWSHVPHDPPLASQKITITVK